MKSNNRSYFPGAMLRRTVAMMCIGMAAVACNNATEPNKGSQSAELKELPRALSAGEAQVRDASNSFSFALLSKVNTAQPNENVFISPLSASFALGMTMNGAANGSFTEMRSALQFGSMSQGAINASYKSLIALLLSLDPAVTLNIANSIWYRNTFAFQQTFFDTTGKYFGATVKGLDFTDKAASLAAINGWASNATNARIPSVLDDITPNDVMFLINAIYFKGSWRDRFDPAKTEAGSFTTSTGTVQTAQLMVRDAPMKYAETSAYQAVDLPYGNAAFSMSVVLPKAGNDINAIASSLTDNSWQLLAGSMATHDVRLWLPKIKLSYERQLKPDLQALGMRAPFDELTADFSNMSSSHNLFISFVKQNTFVDVNEEGTEAAAVTVVGVGVTSAPQSYTMRVDHPYLFVIRDRLSGTILFMGKIARMPA